MAANPLDDSGGKRQRPARRLSYGMDTVKRRVYIYGAFSVVRSRAQSKSRH